MPSHVACVQCRRSKRRCNIHQDGTGCTNCIKTRQRCSVIMQPLQGNRRLAQTRSPSELASSGVNGLISLVAPPSNHRSLLPDVSLRLELVELYCKLLHDKQHALFHKPTLLAETRVGVVEPFLIFAMMAMVARFSQNPYFGGVEPSKRGCEWGVESRRLFDEREVAVSLSAVQGCALLANLAFIQGDSARESLYGAQQIRMVHLLGYPQNLSSHSIQREVEIRIWWTTWMMDTWTSTSMGLEKQVVYRPDYPRPMEEEAFEFLGVQSPSEPPPEPIQDIGLWSQMIPLTEILAKVNALNETIVTRPISRDELFDQVRNLESRLEYWQFCLPPCLHQTLENLEIYKSKGLGRILVALHLGYHHHSLQLFFQFLSLHGADPRYERPISRYTGKCKEHATELSKLMWVANTTPGLECLWSINGHLLVIASAVHLHTLLFDEDADQVSNAKEMLEHNFVLLLELQKYWPSLELSITRLWVFQRACQKKAAHSTFNMNFWMLHFLQRYALPVQDHKSTGLTEIMTPASEDTVWGEIALPPEPTIDDLLHIFLQ